MPQIHSDLPIVTPDPPRKSQAEKYGTLYYLGIGGLVLLVSLVAWFSFGLWSLRGYFREVYVLHNPRQSEEARVNAALVLSRSSQANQRQYWEDALDRGLPDLARYLLAESLTAEATQADPRGYALAVARSEGWPDWLRLLLLRPMAYAADNDRSFPAESLDRLRHNPDPAIGLWAAYVQAAKQPGSDEARTYLAQQASARGENRELAVLLAEALRAEPTRKGQVLDRATRWIRAHHEGAVNVWEPWEFRDDRLVKRTSQNPSASKKDAG